MRNTPDGALRRSRREGDLRLVVPVYWNYRPGYVLVLSAHTPKSERTNLRAPKLTSARQAGFLRTSGRLAGRPMSARTEEMLSINVPKKDT